MGMQLLNGNHKKLNSALKDFSREAKLKSGEISQYLDEKVNDMKLALQDAAIKTKKASVQINKLTRKNPWKVIAGVAAGALLVGFISGWVSKKE